MVFGEKPELMGKVRDLHPPKLADLHGVETVSAGMVTAGALSMKFFLHDIRRPGGNLPPLGPNGEDLFEIEAEETRQKLEVLKEAWCEAGRVLYESMLAGMRLTDSPAHLVAAARMESAFDGCLGDYRSAIDNCRERVGGAETLRERVDAVRDCGRELRDASRECGDRIREAVERMNDA